MMEEEEHANIERMSSRSNSAGVLESVGGDKKIAPALVPGPS